MTKYRIDASFDLIGGFWHSDRPDEKLTGTLTCKNGLGQFVSSPTYTKLDDAAYREAFRNMTFDQILQPVGTILGFTTDKNCTLLGCYALQDVGLTHFPTSEQVAAKHFRASRMVMGLHVDSPDAKSIDSAAFYFTKIHNWLPMPWRSELTVERTTYIVPTSANEPFSFCSLELSAEVVCEIFAGGSNKARKGASIKSVPRLKITPKTPQSVEWYNSLAFRIENFFTLFLGTSVAIKHIQFFQGEQAGWLVQKMRHKQEKVNLQTWVRCPPHRVSNAMAKWLAVPQAERPVEIMLLGSLRKSSVFVETEFLGLAQALEGFGRIHFRKTASEPNSLRSLSRPTTS